MADVKRIVRHLLMTHWQVRRAFPQETLRAIEHAIAASESTHIGQIFFCCRGRPERHEPTQGGLGA